jgi:hypothetical protein
VFRVFIQDDLDEVELLGMSMTKAVKNAQMLPREILRKRGRINLKTGRMSTEMVC